MLLSFDDLAAGRLPPQEIEIPGYGVSIPLRPMGHKAFEDMQKAAMEVDAEERDEWVARNLVQACVTKRCRRDTDRPPVRRLYHQVRFSIHRRGGQRDIYHQRFAH